MVKPQFLCQLRFGKKPGMLVNRHGKMVLRNGAAQIKLTDARRWQISVGKPGMLVHRHRNMVLGSGSPGAELNSQITLADA